MRLWILNLGMIGLHSPRFGTSPECECEGLHAWIEKLDFELAISNGFGLPDQLVETLFGHCPVALVVNINAVGRARRLSIDQHAKSHRMFLAPPGP